MNPADVNRPPKRKQVKSACRMSLLPSHSANFPVVACRQASRGCDEERPCRRCRSRGIVCEPAPPRRRRVFSITHASYANTPGQAPVSGPMYGLRDAVSGMFAAPFADSPSPTNTTFAGYTQPVRKNTETRLSASTSMPNMSGNDISTGLSPAVTNMTLQLPPAYQPYYYVHNNYPTTASTVVPSQMHHTPLLQPPLLHSSPNSVPSTLTSSCPTSAASSDIILPNMNLIPFSLGKQVTARLQSDSEMLARFNKPLTASQSSFSVKSLLNEADDQTYYPPMLAKSRHTASP